ncbi:MULTISPECIES: NAD(P)-dependent oxidoreductase [unclassified Haladaptatus]|uniref:NAD-dependent epimerase/dehydratase family protein n=1 Tax=unclassified Haladaptatus TaxID=2622732 RepID=UPI0023E7C69E|nr:MULTISPECIES: NAD(P)-dependent oxidoreductase [unclassified Haladaptatus]
MNVLLTGAYGRVGTAIIDHLAGDDEYDFTYLDKTDHPDHETVVADIADYEATKPAFEGADAVVHLAGYPYTDGDWRDILESNIIGLYNALEAAAEAEVETFVFASSNHAVGMYEIENAPDIYFPEFDLTVDHTDPVRPDSYYGTSKSFGEDLGRYYVENEDYPKSFYGLRICSVRHEEYDHPYGDAERGVDEDRWERDSDEYAQAVARMKAMWQSRRDLAHMVDRCLQTDGVAFDIFYGVSTNDRRWFDIDHACEVIDYEPQDNGDKWDGPPAR